MIRALILPVSSEPAAGTVGQPSLVAKSNGGSISLFNRFIDAVLGGMT